MTIALVVFATSSACVRLSAAGARVAVVATEQDVATCGDQGSISGIGDNVWDAMIDVRNHAAEIGATHLFVTFTDPVRYGSSVVANAYDCTASRGGRQSVQLVEKLPGCGKDTDCKGDRICVAGECRGP